MQKVISPAYLQYSTVPLESRSGEERKGARKGGSIGIGGYIKALRYITAGSEGRFYNPLCHCSALSFSFFSIRRYGKASAVSLTFSALVSEDRWIGVETGTELHHWRSSYWRQCRQFVSPFTTEFRPREALPLNTLPTSPIRSMAQPRISRPMDLSQENQRLGGP